MRTTITLEPDVVALVQRIMRERHLTFKQAVNEALRAALRPAPARKDFRAPTFRMEARPEVDLTKALELAGYLEDEVLLDRMREEGRPAG